MKKRTKPENRGEIPRLKIRYPTRSSDKKSVKILYRCHHFHAVIWQNLERATCVCSVCSVQTFHLYSPEMLGFLNSSSSDRRQRQRQIDERRCNIHTKRQAVRGATIFFFTQQFITRCTNTVCSSLLRMCVSLRRTWLAHSEMVSQGTRGVVVVGPRRFPGCWEGKYRWVQNEKFDEVTYAWRWRGITEWYWLWDDTEMSWKHHFLERFLGYLDI